MILIPLYSEVKLTVTVPEYGLIEGQVGTVLQQYAVHPTEPQGYEVEFMERGRTIAVVALDETQIKLNEFPSELQY